MNRLITLLPLGMLACVIYVEDPGTKTPPSGDTGTTVNTTDTGGTTPGGFVFATDDPSVYARVDRMGMPAVATAVITSDDAYNGADPVDDAAGTFVGEIIANVDFLHSALDDDLTGLGLSPCGGSPTEPSVGQCIDQAAPFVVPDVITLDLSQPSGFPNGRALPDPVIDVTLALILLDLNTHAVDFLAGLPLNPPMNDVPFPTGFPYLAPAQ
ncbi:MAG TPA: DUF4331 domain-containing protein [Deltaproteobacteria bacterium]|nr:DUF4331 domain-containing protein [Deltaproteobacteria bacterium]